MRILHVPYSFYPDPAGGTEVYVAALAAWQRTMGWDAAVAAPAGPNASPARYVHDGTPVWRLETSKTLTLPQLYGEGDPRAAEAFAEVLGEFHPDVVHLHAFTSAASVLLADQAVRKGIALVFNYHTPTASCARGTLLKWGREVCDGTLSGAGANPCAACSLHANGLPRPVASLVASLPQVASGTLERAGLAGGMWTALRTPELTRLRIRAFQNLMQKSDRVVALCHWTRDLLRRNGVPENKITVCRQGISWSLEHFEADAGLRPARLPLRAVFLGRSDPAKGAGVVIQGLKDHPKLPVHLDLFGVSQGGAGDRYAARLQEMAGNDPRIRILPPLPSGEVVSRLKDYGLLVVPSQGFETGPLVVLEAFAARIPVIGSDLGGISELVTNGIDGLLVSPYESPAAWGAALRRICSEPELLVSLRAGIRPPRHARDAARELMPVYEDLVRSACSASAKNSR